LPPVALSPARERGDVASALRRYGLAAGFSVLAVVLTVRLGDLRHQTPYLLSFGAVMLASWLGGFGPGLLATAITALGVDYYVRAPIHQLWLKDDETALTAVFYVAVATAISWLNAARRRAEEDQTRLLMSERAIRAEVDAAEARSRFLAEASEVLAASLDYREAPAQVVRLVVPSLADWCVVDLLGDDGALHRLAIVHGDPACAAASEELRRRYPTIPPDATHTAWTALRSGRAWFDPEVSPARLAAQARDDAHLALLREVGFGSELVVPLVARGRPLGVLTLVHGASGRRYGAADVAMAEDLARHCALAIDNARLYREARDAEARLRRLFDAGVIGFVVADADRIVEANDHFLAMVGYDRADLDAGRLRWPAMTPPEYAELDARGIAEIGERGFCTPFEKEIFRRDGSRVPILIGTAEVQPDPPLRISCVLDLTALKRAEHDRLAFVDAATHDLKNPLTSLRAQAQLMLRRARRGQLGDAATFETGLAAIDDASRRMIGLIDELMDAAHLRAGRMLDLNLAPTDLVAVARDAAGDAERATTAHTVVFETTEAELVGDWDRVRLERILQNLLGNAVKYSPQGGRVVVRVAREDEPCGRVWATVAVQDDGLGIPAADLPHVFDRFRRGGNVGGITGAGIGLAGVRQIVEQHGGTIGVESVEEQGSTFTVRLPVAPPAEPPLRP
jgi:PAS domain S-box-containing protein